MNPQPKVKPWRSEKYRRWVASLPCCICYTIGCNAHHENLNGGKMGGKESDEFCIPLCTLHHCERHERPGRFWQRHHKDAATQVANTQRQYVTRPWEDK